MSDKSFSVKLSNEQMVIENTLLHLWKQKRTNTTASWNSHSYYVYVVASILLVPWHFVCKQNWNK